MSLGIDAFALNVGAPTADWAKDAIDQLFQAAGTTNGGFKLFFSFDLVAADNMQDHINLWTQYSGNDAYFTYGSDNLPLVSSFGGYSQLDNWSSFKSGNQVSLIPNLDDANINDYYTSTSSYLSQYTDIVDGFFSWESAWPAPSDTPSNLSSTWDQNVQSFAHGASKAYMMGKPSPKSITHDRSNTEIPRTIRFAIQGLLRRQLLSDRRSESTAANVPDP